MGATNIHYSYPIAWGKDGKDLTPSEAYDILYEQAVHDYGHDPYSGTIATCELGGSIRKPKDDDDYFDLLDTIDKREVKYYRDDEAGKWVFIGWAAC